MQLPITIGLHRSRFLGMALVSGYGLAAAAVVMTPWERPLKALLLAGLASAALFSLAKKRRCVGLRLGVDGCLACRLAGEKDFRAAALLPGATVYPWLTVLTLESERGRVVAVVLPDSTTSEEFRRLRVWLRWRARFSRPGDGA